MISATGEWRKDGSRTDLKEGKIDRELMILHDRCVDHCRREGKGVERFVNGMTMTCKEEGQDSTLR